MSTGEQGVYGQDNNSQSTMYFLFHHYRIVSFTLTSYHILHCARIRALKICWCNSAALCLSPRALRMWSRGMLCFYLGITVAQRVTICQHRRIRFRQKDKDISQPGIHEIVFLMPGAVITKPYEIL